MVTSLGGVLRPVNEQRTQYVVNIPNLPKADGPVPIIFRTPEPSVQWNQFPRIMVGIDDVSTALERYHPITEEYRVFSPGTPVGPTPSLDPSQPDPVGPNSYEAKIQAWPFDLTYTIEAWHRMENWALLMIFHVMRKFPPYGIVTIVDSLGDQRTYDAFMQGGPKNLTEALGMTDRGSGFALTVRVTGELDLAIQPEEPETLPTFRTLQATIEPSDPATIQAFNDAGKNAGQDS